MSDQSLSTAPNATSLAGLVLHRRTLATLLVALAIVALTVGTSGARLAGLLQTAHLHLPDVALLARASPAIKIHLVTVLAAFAIGTALMIGRKGRTAHRVLGWAFVVFMVITAIASLFIHAQNPGHFSLLHLFSGWVLFAAPFGLVAARRHKVRLHGRMMTGLYTGGLVVAGLLTFIPGRLMWRVFFG